MLLRGENRWIVSFGGESIGDFVAHGWENRWVISLEREYIWVVSHGREN